ncbi:MAG: hypothetical protein KKC51_13905 [Verrucomicrobia bacterium]|nr:hypothetical protein [Verrucomicrobiota bacterium]
MIRVAPAAIIACLLLSSGGAIADSFPWRPTVEYGRQLVEDGTWCGKAVDERALIFDGDTAGSADGPYCPELLLQSIKYHIQYRLGNFIDEDAMIYHYGSVNPNNYPTNIYSLTETGVLAQCNLPTNYFSYTPSRFLDTHPNGFNGAYLILKKMIWTSPPVGILGKKRTLSVLKHTLTYTNWTTCSSTNSVDDCYSFDSGPGVAGGSEGGEWYYSWSGQEGAVWVGSEWPGGWSGWESGSYDFGLKYVGGLADPAYFDMVPNCTLYVYYSGGGVGGWTNVGITPPPYQSNYVFYTSGNSTKQYKDTCSIGEWLYGLIGACAVQFPDVFSTVDHPWWRRGPVGDPNNEWHEDRETGCGYTFNISGLDWLSRFLEWNISFVGLAKWDFEYK